MLSTAILSDAPWMHTYGWLIGVCGAGFLGVLMVLWEYAGTRRRMCRFSRRQIRGEGESIEKVFQVDKKDSEFVFGFLDALARDIGINWTQLRPDDSFEDVIRVKRCFRSFSDLEETEHYVIDWARKCGINSNCLPAFEGSLAQHIRRLLLAFEAGQPVA